MSHPLPALSPRQKPKSIRVPVRRIALSLLIGGLFCSAAPAWADCVVNGTNANGGLNITCDGENIEVDPQMLDGGLSNNNITVQGDGVTVNGTNSIYGGYGGLGILSDDTSATVTRNSVTLNDSVIQGPIYGGYVSLFAAIKGDSNIAATDNTVTLNGNSNAHSVYAGYASTQVHDSANQSAGITIAGNTIILNENSSVNDLGGGYSLLEIYTSTGTPVTNTITGNTIILNDNSTGAAVYGGYSLLAINASTGTPVTNTITGNTIILNDNSTGAAVYGGYARNNINGDVTRNIKVSDNTIIFNGNSSADNAVGGYGGDNGHNSDIFVTNNTISINDTAAVQASLAGGNLDWVTSGNYDAFTGNTLNFAAAPIIIRGEMANFENYNFTVDPALRNTDKALITAQTITFGTNETNMKGGDANTSKIKVVGIKAGNELFADDKFVLMQATGIMSGDAEGLTTNGVAQQGISLLYDVRTDVDTDGKLVTATIIGKEKPVDPEKPVEPGKPAARVNPQLKALSEGHLASAMMLTRGADTLAYNTVHTIQHQNPDKGLAPFITLSGDKTRYNSGSHIDAKDGRLTGGVSYQTEKLTSAVLIESGWGSYTTHNGFATMNDVNGDGHNRYTGAAVLGHYDFDSGMFAEASLRAGKNRNTFDTKDIVNLSTGEKAHYNLDSNYLGAHIGTGYSKALDEKNTADVSAKYLWTQLKGKDVKIAGDNIHFDDINSHRVRLDAGLSHKYTDAVALRAGLGYEYEFDGKAQASTYGYGIGAPSVQGSTAIMTVGATVTPMANQAFTVDVNASGYTGQRDGIGGNIKFSYAF